jgi:hypothetical protein
VVRIVSSKRSFLHLMIDDNTSNMRCQEKSFCIDRMRSSSLITDY